MKKTLFWAIFDILLVVVIASEGFVLKKRWDARVISHPDKEVSETAAPTPAPASWSDVCSGIEDVLADATGTWEVYIPDTQGGEDFRKSSGRNMKAGSIGRFFLTEQTYRHISDGKMDASCEEDAELLLQQGDSGARGRLLEKLPDERESLEDGTERIRIHLDEEYLDTFWHIEGTDSTIYTSAADGSRLLQRIAEKSGAGDSYSGKEKEFLQQEIYAGSIKSALGDTGAEVLECFSEDDGMLEDFACINANGTSGVMGIKVEDVTDPEACKNKIGEIAKLFHGYLAGAGAGEQKKEPEESKAPSPTAEETPAAGQLKELKKTLNQQIAAYSGVYDIYVKDLYQDAELSIPAGQKMKAASLIKLYVMASVYDQIRKGALQESEEIDSLLTNMITISDNESTNELVRRLSPDGTNWDEGSKVTNAYIGEHGYMDTDMGRDVRDNRVTPPPGENYTSAGDCGRILDAIYHGECVSAESSAKMLELLKQQTRRGKIPAGVEGAAYVANKTGELDGVENDAAIVQLDDSHAYILCVMSEDSHRTGTAVSNIVEISRTVCQYFREH